MNLALGALALHTIGTPSLDTPEPTRDLAESRDPYIEDTESRIQNREGHHRHHVTAEPPLIPIPEPRLDLAVGHILPDIHTTTSTIAEYRTLSTPYHTQRCAVPRRLPRHAIYDRGPITPNAGPRRGENPWHCAEAERVANNRRRTQRLQATLAKRAREAAIAARATPKTVEAVTTTAAAESEIAIAYARAKPE